MLAAAQLAKWKLATLLVCTCTLIEVTLAVLHDRRPFSIQPPDPASTDTLTRFDAVYQGAHENLMGLRGITSGQSAHLHFSSLVPG